MRALIAAALLVAAASSAAADIVVGNGRAERERRSVPPFRSISLSGAGTLRVRPGQAGLEIESDSNVLPYITAIVSNGELVLGFKPGLSLSGVSKLEFDVTLPDLAGVSLAGSGEAFIDRFSGESFAGRVTGSGGMKADLAYGRVVLESSGSGSFDAAVRARELRLRCSGSGGARLSGSADSASVEILGSGSVAGRDFAALDARVALNGSGRAEIRARKDLGVAINGSGSLRYWGNPTLSRSVRGSGSIERVGD